MKLARFVAQGTVSLGVVEEERVEVIQGDPFGEFQETGTSYPLSEVRLLAPWIPGKMLAAARNYHSHARWSGREVPAAPEMFYKVPSSVIGPGEAIVLPQGTEHVDEEGELVVVMGKRARKVSPERALDYVFGYTCGNDVSARDWQRNDRQWWRAKSADTFSPLGPVIVTGLDPAKLELIIRVNGEEHRRSTTDLLVFDVPTMISYISQVVTLEPGDMIFTGTPGAPRTLQHGDVVEVEVPKIGVLRNPVVAEGMAGK
ncbi:MAG: fumarylacetoacetate hydrolase family protein [Dehalococcoidia bacterium]